MTTNQIVAGRGGSNHYIHLKLECSPDISREHFRLRRDEQAGEFFIRDLSAYGTAVNGKKLPSSIEEVNGIRRDINREELLPRRASIRLADALMLEFEATEEK
jgi:predicted component of type VI protein secretion system